MTPREWMEQLRQLIAKEREREALDLAGRLSSEMLPQLTDAEFVYVIGLMEEVQAVVDALDGTLVERPTTLRLPTTPIR